MSDNSNNDESSSNNINVSIKCSNADKAEMNIDKTISVLDLKKLIEVKLSVPSIQQRYFFLFIINIFKIIC